MDSARFHCLFGACWITRKMLKPYHMIYNMIILYSRNRHLSRPSLLFFCQGALKDGIKKAGLQNACLTLSGTASERNGTISARHSENGARKPYMLLALITPTRGGACSKALCNLCFRIAMESPCSFCDFCLHISSVRNIT